MKNLNIITVVRNDFKNLKKTYHSINKLISAGAKWIVVDGGNDEQTFNWCKNLKSANFKYLREIDSGIYDAMNKGIRLSEKDSYLWFLNSGDTNLIEKDVLNKKLKKAKDDAFSVIKFNLIVNKKIRSENINKFFLIFNSPNHQSIFVKKEIHDLFYDDLKLAGDYGNFLNVFFDKNFKLLDVNEAIVSYDLDGITSRNDQKNTIRLERIKSSYRSFIRNKKLFILLIVLIQSIMYLPYFMFPKFKIKRFKD